MTIEINEPELQAILEERMASGRFLSLQDVLLQALKSVPAAEQSSSPVVTGKSLVDAFRPIRGLFADGELDFSRDKSPLRPVDFS